MAATQMADAIQAKKVRSNEKNIFGSTFLALASSIFTGLLPPNIANNVLESGLGLPSGGGAARKLVDR
jgi:hypothetical protein